MLSEATQLVLDHIRTTNDVEPWVRNHLGDIASTQGRIVWLRRYVADKVRTARVLSELGQAMRKRALRPKDVDWPAIVARFSRPSTTQTFLDSILAGEVDLRLAYTIQRFEIVPAGTSANEYPEVHAFVSYQPDDQELYADAQTYIETGDGGEMLDLEDPELPDREKLFRRLEDLCSAYKRARDGMQPATQLARHSPS